LVDPVYGLRDGFFLSTIKRKYRGSKKEEERPLLSRTPLHAQSLSFKHPISKEILKFESELPKDINACLKQIRKWKPYKDQIHLYE
jgi:23S rRNA-/tRNA-specific pseudouridylate synthase